ncbi:acylglycerol kinase, mitochondrial-like [Acanthaster planci]|uniref:Acylglycerol kinase, mitochondrial n=1 Tax=Acanthaster planci TaxID=133434 RepID=A0A8B7XYJ6_ACAPL|nr:acylglycerol kinase, mitochondrial-like [Acanthaster planci]
MAARIVKVAKTVRNHWKKSTAAVILAGWGVYFVQDRYRANLLREEFCRRAIIYGQETIKYATEKPRKVTVILNPAAKNGKAKKLFDKNAAPLLHLAGIDMEIVKTESEGNAKEKAAYLEATDAVVVAGGDGTVGEVITGLLRREDEASISVRWPLGIIPVGTTNSLARFLYANAESDVRWMGNAALAVIRGLTEPVDVMAIQGEDGRKVFTVNNLEWGPLQEARQRSTKYWYFGSLKWKLTYVFATLKNAWPPVLKANIKHRPAFEVPEPEVVVRNAGIDWWAWLQRLMIWRNSPKESKESEANTDDEGTEAEKEIKWTEDDIVTTELVVATGNRDVVKMSPRGLRLTKGPAELSRTEYIREGWRRTDSSQEGASGRYKTQTEEVGEVKITPVLKEGVEAWYSVDNDRLEAQPITVQILPKKLQFFTDRQDRDSVIGGPQRT